jgi:hypothetical protein
MDSQGLNNKNNDDKLIGWNGVPSQTTPVWEKGKGMDWSSQGPWVLRFRCVMWWHTPLWDNLLNQMDRYYIWAPAKILYIWVVAIYGYRFFWGGPIAFQGFVEISMFEILSCMHLPFNCIHVISFSFHVPFIGIQFHKFSFHIPFIFIPMCIYVPSSSFH